MSKIGELYSEIQQLKSDKHKLTIVNGNLEFVNISLSEKVTNLKAQIELICKEIEPDADFKVAMLGYSFDTDTCTMIHINKESACAPCFLNQQLNILTLVGNGNKCKLRCTVCRQKYAQT